ncbi:MAG TPA: methyltransferase domain-containing protein [Candidatus Limnocylindria bacterium]|nr:methyltransferase domain-containing protein [Candidatus Limnocylindria bacterium]
MRRPCPICGSTQAADWGRKGAMRLVCCARCSLVFEGSPAAEFRDGTFYENTGAEFYLSPDKLRGDHSPVRYRREIRLLREFCPRGRILDIGCGTGGFLHQLSQAHPGDYEVVGSDIAGPALDHAEGLGIPILRGDLAVTLPGQPLFDAVTFWAVLEHLPDPAALLTIASRALKPGGICIALVPNVDSLAIRCLGVKYRYILPQHLNYFSGATLRALFAKLPGMRVMDTRWTHFNPVVLWQDWRGHEELASDENRARLLAKTNALKADRRWTPLRWAYQGVEGLLAIAHLADNVVVIARKT